MDEKEPIPLPNLDYKIMQGNSLFESYEKVDLSNLTGRKDKVQETDLFGKPLNPNLSFDFDDSADIDTLLGFLAAYFDKHEEKSVIRDSIKCAVLELVRKRGVSNEIFDKLEEIDLHENGKFFLWHTWFNDVFERGGFDIVIANPPYVNVQLMGEREKELYKAYYSVFIKRCDMFALFMELALTKLASSTGTVSFIIPSVVHSNMSYTKLRDLMLENRWLREVCYTGGDVFNAPTVDTTILICDKKAGGTMTLKNAVDFENPIVKTVPADYFAAFDNVISVGGTDDSDSIFAKLLNKDFERLDAQFSVYQGIVTGNNPAFIFESEAEALEKGADKRLLHPLCHGRDIEKFMVRSRERRILYIDDSVDIEKFPKTKKWLLNFKEALSNRREAKKGTIQWFGLQWPRVKAELDLQEKILLQRTRNEALKTRIVATLDDQGVYGSEGIYFIIPKTKGANLRYLLGILNSKPLNYLFATKFLNLAVKAEYVKQIRLPSATKEQQKPIIALVDEILRLKSGNDTGSHSKGAKATEKSTSALEREIDMLVYKLYELSEEEIKVVEGK